MADRPERSERPRGHAMTSYRCEVCEYEYDEQVGDAREGFPPGTAWTEVPDDWACPDCGVREKVDFVEVKA